MKIILLLNRYVGWVSLELVMLNSVNLSGGNRGRCYRIGTFNTIQRNGCGVLDRSSSVIWLKQAVMLFENQILE